MQSVSSDYDTISRGRETRYDHATTRSIQSSPFATIKTVAPFGWSTGGEMILAQRWLDTLPELLQGS